MFLIFANIIELFNNNYINLGNDIMTYSILYEKIK